jgi:hypothetical protein
MKNQKSLILLSSLLLTLMTAEAVMATTGPSADPPGGNLPDALFNSVTANTGVSGTASVKATSTGSAIQATGNPAVTATSNGTGLNATGNPAVTATGKGAYGVVGDGGSDSLGNSGIGVAGISDGNYGLFGSSNSSNGIYGYSKDGNGVQAYSQNGAGVVATVGSTTAGSYGVLGFGGAAAGAFQTNWLGNGIKVLLATASNAIEAYGDSDLQGIVKNTKKLTSGFFPATDCLAKGGYMNAGICNFPVVVDDPEGLHVQSGGLDVYGSVINSSTNDSGYVKVDDNLDVTGGVYNQKPQKIVDGVSYKASDCTNDGGYYDPAISNSCDFPVYVKDDDGIRTTKISITGGSTGGTAGTIGGMDKERYGAQFSVTSVNPSYATGTYFGGLVKGYGPFMGADFKYTASGSNPKPSTEVKLTDGNFAIDASGDVNVTGSIANNATGLCFTFPCTPPNLPVTINDNLKVNGNITATGTITPSDSRLKDVKGQFTKGLSALLKLNPVSYAYKKNNAKNLPSEVSHVGILAQDLQKVLPEAVSKDEQGYLSVSNEPLIWTVINAIKDLNKLMENSQSELTAKVTQLEQENADLKQQLEKSSQEMSSLESRIAKLERFSK